MNGSEFFDAVYRRDQGKCWLAGFGLCRGQWDAHHIVTKGRIKRQYPHGGVLLEAGRERIVAPAGRDLPDGVARITQAEIVWDARCGVLVCRHHHDEVTTPGVRKLVIPRSLVPAHVEEFAREHGLGWSLDRDFGEVADAA